MRWNYRYMAYALLAVAALTAFVAASAFTYRWMEAEVSINAPMCIGFYSSIDQPGIPLPTAGTGYNAPTANGDHISVKPGAVACEWSSGSRTYRLYESISMSLPLTPNPWYLKDVYGFGYNGTAKDPPVYVYVKVETPISKVEKAELILVNASTDDIVAKIDLTKADTYGPIVMNPGTALKIDLWIYAKTKGDYTFKVGFYATEKAMNEKP